ncbi:MAG TPA: hypothetical protein VK988_08165 [Acidimicrobiales bacterium]|nr:hypothetical protein [Acidimicrobiales bacterium]
MQLIEPLLIAVEATDDRLPRFYDPLASRLEGRGSVYVPHVVIPPNARMAVRRPPCLVVGLTSPDDMAEVVAWAREYLSPAAEGSELQFERLGRRIVLRAGAPDGNGADLRSLVTD